MATSAPKGAMVGAAFVLYPKGITSNNPDSM